MSKSWKKQSESGDLPNFGIKKAGPNFQTFDIRKAFNCLWLVFTKAPVLWHFDSECHILDQNWYIKLFKWWNAKLLEFQN